MEIGTRDAASDDGAQVHDTAATPDGATDDAAEQQRDSSVAAAGEAVDTVINEFDAFRVQIADIVPLGPSDFAVGYRTANDQLKYASWDANGRLGAATWAGDDVPWMRADTSGPLQRHTVACDGLLRTNTMAVEIGTTVTAVRLDIHAVCAGRRSMVSHAIGSGARPASATMAPAADAPAKTLVVYGRDDLLAGRFLYPSGNPTTDDGAGDTLSEEFPITHFTRGAVFSTDVIYNQHSRRFIVGYIQRGGFECSIWNVVLDGDTFPPAVLAGPTQFGMCDGDRGAITPAWRTTPAAMAVMPGGGRT